MNAASAIKHRMTEVSPIERRLREWGMVYGVRPATEREPEGETALHRASVDRSREAQTANRAPTSYTRTTVMLRRLRGAVGAFVPAWATDPVRCVETRTPGAPWHPPEEATAVDDAVRALGRFDPRAALCLRASYCLIGRRPLSERIAWASQKGAGNLSRMGYRAALARGRIHVAAALKIAC